MKYRKRRQDLINKLKKAVSKTTTEGDGDRDPYGAVDKHLDKHLEVLSLGGKVDRSSKRTQGLANNINPGKSLITNNVLGKHQDRISDLTQGRKKKRLTVKKRG